MEKASHCAGTVQPQPKLWVVISTAVIPSLEHSIMKTATTKVNSTPARPRTFSYLNKLEIYLLRFPDGTWAF